MADKLYFEGQVINGVLFKKDLGYSKSKRRGVFVCPVCNCDYETGVNHVTRGKSKSCGCEVVNSRTHGMRKSDEYRTWCKMKERCNNPKTIGYGRYGGAGIKISEDWESFEKFYFDMGPRPTVKHSIERVDVKKGYSKSNCKWATTKEQARNKNNTLRVAFKGKLIPLIEACEILGLNYELVKGRKNQRGITVQQAFDLSYRQPSIFIPHAFGLIAA